MNQKVKNSIIKRGEKDLDNFDKQIATLIDKAKKAVLPFEEKINELQRLKEGLVDYLSKFQSSNEDTSIFNSHPEYNNVCNPNTTEDEVK